MNRASSPADTDVILVAGRVLVLAASSAATGVMAIPARARVNPDSTMLSSSKSVTSRAGKLRASAQITPRAPIASRGTISRSGGASCDNFSAEALGTATHTTLNR